MHTAQHSDRLFDTTGAAAAPALDRALAGWLFACCALVFAMVVLGGVTRLTGSGLSIVEWEPLMGAIPPLSDAAWAETFAEYRGSPEYRQKNFGMSLPEFKRIFWFEYAHRLLGRVIGAAVLIPLLYFWLRRRLPPGLAPRLFAVFALGGLQGALGWYMVASGLIDDPRVSPYRLTAHLALACVIYGWLLWLALGLWQPRGGATAVPARLRRGSYAVLGLIGLMVIAGGFVAGTKAGYAYNSFPLMDGRFVPVVYGDLEPFWRNFFENIAAVQFNHRWLAFVTLLAIFLLWAAGRKFATPLPPAQPPAASPAIYRNGVGRALNALLLIALLQIALGIATLLLHVPLALAAAHQAGALVLWSAGIYLLHRQRVG